jgi:hypothetical protein
MDEHKEAAGCRCCEETVARARTCIRERPAEAALISGCAGFLFAQLPLRRLVAVGLWLVKPAAVFYGLYRLADDCRAGRWRSEDREKVAPKEPDTGE